MSKSKGQTSGHTTLLYILSGISVFMTFFLGIWSAGNLRGFINYAGINRTIFDIPLSWTIAIITTIGYIAYSALAIPLVKKNLFRFTGLLKWISIYAAATGSIVEELVFRRMLMDAMARNQMDVILQILASGVAFGLVHLTWSLLGGNWRVGIGSTISTIILGLCLASIYILANRNVFPAIAAHFLINLFIEPWLLLNAINGGKNTKDTT